MTVFLPSFIITPFIGSTSNSSEEVFEFTPLLPSLKFTDKLFCLVLFRRPIIFAAAFAMEPVLRENLDFTQK